MAFTEKNMRHNGRTIVWVRQNGVSFLACEKLRRYYQPFDGVEREWHRPGEGLDDEYTVDSATCEIAVAKRIKSRVIPGEKFFEAMWEYEKAFENICELSKAFYGRCDNHSPMWGAIEGILHDQAALAIKFQFEPEEYKRTFHDPANRIAHGLRPLEG